MRTDWGRSSRCEPKKGVWIEQLHAKATAAFLSAAEISAIATEES